MSGHFRFSRDTDQRTKNWAARGTTVVTMEMKKPMTLTFATHPGCLRVIINAMVDGIMPIRGAQHSNKPNTAQALATNETRFTNRCCKVKGLTDLSSDKEHLARNSLSHDWH